MQLLPALKVNNYDVHRKCRQYLFYYTETLFTIMLDAINTYLCVFILCFHKFINVFLTSGQYCNSGMQKRIHFRTDMEHNICFFILFSNMPFFQMIPMNCIPSTSHTKIGVHSYTQLLLTLKHISTI